MPNCIVLVSQGVDLASGDLLTIKNLLDIFSVLMCLPPTPRPHTTDADDSNLITSEGECVYSMMLILDPTYM